MDAAAAASERDYLTEFIDSLSNEEEEEKHESREQQNCAPTQLGCNGEEDNGEEEAPAADVWTDIADAMNQWTQKILDAETRYSRTVSFRENIEASLQRQLLDGFLNHHDIAELRYIADLWTNLLHSTSSYSIGCEFAKRDIITFLLELHKVRQITDCLLIEACLKL